MNSALLIVGAVAAGLLAVGVLAHFTSRRYRQWQEFRLRVRIEDTLKHLHSAEERNTPATIESLAGHLGMPIHRARRIAQTLQQRGLATITNRLSLTKAGRQAARQIVRAHRLWERYLADELNAPIAEIHRRADEHEHHMKPAEVEHLAASLGHPQHDPHGDPIPTAQGHTESLPGWPITLMPQALPTRIVHLEDEPPETFARLIAEGLALGQRVSLEDRQAHKLSLDVKGRRLELSPIDAANIFVTPMHEEPRVPGQTLADLQTGERARVLDVQVTGFSRRRLYDLGFTPGAPVECAFPAAFGEPRAYRVRGTIIALRPEQARRIEVEPIATTGSQ